LAAALGMTLAGATDPLVQVSDALQGKRALLVFDNSEPLAGIAPFAERLAQACAPLKLLVTSRARRAIAGEWLLLLAGLPVPDADETEAAAQRAFDAVKLFERRAWRRPRWMRCARSAKWC
jgi:predicted ATPase